jgi:hypothetical protein
MTKVAVRSTVPYSFLIGNVNGKPKYHKQAHVEQTVARVSEHSCSYTVTLLDDAGA